MNGDLIKAAKLWAKISQKTGGTYYVGRMGGCRVLILENRDRQGEQDPTHWLMLGDAEAGPERDPARRPASRPEPAAKASASPVERDEGQRQQFLLRPQAERPSWAFHGAGNAVP